MRKVNPSITLGITSDLGIASYPELLKPGISSRLRWINFLYCTPLMLLSLMILFRQQKWHPNYRKLCSNHFPKFILEPNLTWSNSWKISQLKIESSSCSSSIIYLHHSTICWGKWSAFYATTTLTTVISGQKQQLTNKPLLRMLWNSIGYNAVRLNSSMPVHADVDGKGK